MFYFFSLFLAGIVAVPLWVVSVQCCLFLAAMRSRYSDILDDKTDLSRVVVLIPAHNEAMVIAAALEELTRHHPDRPEVVVVADNCTDKTADIARQYNVTVLERHDNRNLGKGYALDFGIQFLKKQAGFEVLVILDADCQFTPLSLERLVNQCARTKMPTQAVYQMHLSGAPTITQRIAGFAWLVKNKIRPVAVSFLKLPVTLTGTGMAFPWRLVDRLNLAHGHIVEDMQLGIDLSIKGDYPRLCPGAEVFSYFPEQQFAQKTQRTRWEHGHLLTILQRVPGLLKFAISKRDVRLLALAMDISVPPLALLVTIAFTGIVLSGLAWGFASWKLPFIVLLVSFVVFALGILAVWWWQGRSFLRIADLFAIPYYILSKLGIYLSFFVKRQKAWVRTERDVKR